MILNPIVKPQTGGAKNSSVSPSFSSGWMLGVWRPIRWCRSFWHFPPKNAPKKNGAREQVLFLSERCSFLGSFWGFTFELKRALITAHHFFDTRNLTIFSEIISWRRRPGKDAEFPGSCFQATKNTLWCFGTFRKPSWLSRVSS